MTKIITIITKQAKNKLFLILFHFFLSDFFYIHMKLSAETRSVFWVVVDNYLKRDIFKEPKLGQEKDNKYIFNIVYSIKPTHIILK